MINTTKKKNNYLFLVVLIILLSALFIFSGCTSTPAQAPGNKETQTGQQSQPPAQPGVQPGTHNPQTFNVNIQNFAFNPSSLSINSGDTIVWKNMDSVSHTIISDSGNEISSNSLSNGDIYSHTFNQKGTFDYHCSIHPSMKAKIIVS